MFKTIFLLFVLAHILGDFYLQTPKLAEEKNNKYSKLLIHSLIYLIISLSIVVALISINKWMILGVIIISLCHFIIDTLKFLYLKKYKKSHRSPNERGIYIVDQLVHIATLFFISIVIANYIPKLQIPNYLNYIFETINIPAYLLLKWVVLILLIIKPTNITIKKLLNSYRPKDEELIKTEKKGSGSFIGILERLVIAIFLAINQYSAIGLVLTAKSIARYNKISNEKEFAEYYLLGTLMSTVIVILAYLLVI
ncbi:MAG: hypothetical protein A2Y17_09065 [Clostridiales bacterium GWF2_38_85]|nr:MAG: hypothetical protein A2Y17_09065 [Clostridiales bacterium GWF2_38_85]HBL83653.1 DUF3307 domain-containing protein [Clostridiales bacterium]